MASKTRGCLLPCLAIVLCNTVTAQTDAFHASEPVSLEITYDLQAGNFGTGKGRLKLHANDGRLSYELTIKPTGLARLFGDSLDVSARMRIEKERVLAEEYMEKHRKNETRRQHYRFEANRSTVKVLHEGKTYSLKVPEGALDEASMQIQLILDTQRHDGPWHYAVVSNGKIKHYRFTEVGSENIDSAFGRIRTIKIRRARLRNGKESDTDYHYWLSPTHRYLPIKAEKLENGKVKRTLTAQAIRFK